MSNSLGDGRVEGFLAGLDADSTLTLDFRLSISSKPLLIFL